MAGEDVSPNETPLRTSHIIHEHDSSINAFAHALRLAVAFQGTIEIVDVRPHSDDVPDFSVRSMYEKWGWLPESSSRDAVSGLGISVKKLRASNNYKKVIKKRFTKHDNDLLVIGLNPRRTFGRLFGSDLTSFLVNTFRQTTLYIPEDCRGFVDFDTGDIRLDTILLPTADFPFAFDGLMFLSKTLPLLKSSPQIIGIHDGRSFPEVTIPNNLMPYWQEETYSENIVSLINRQTEARKADLIVMTTNGRDTLPQKITGSITEQVLKHVTCPVLAVAVPQ
ncbi:MAG: hypothetical protein GF398_14740 [Chitinivibrionales bacterium]|nr:hypothetical protein [Chitinivibrionales bacterium]